MKMMILHRGSRAPEVHHFRPLITYSSPSRRIVLWMFVASDEATSGSVIEKHDRISPASNGSSHRRLCSSVPNRSSVSMLPVSGAEQLKTSGAMGERPMISHSGAYSRLERPAPRSESGRKRFHSPAALASAFSSSRMGGGCQRPTSSSWRS